MTENDKKSSRLGDVVNTMYLLNADIAEQRPKLAAVLKSIENEFEWVLNNTMNTSQICEALNITEPTLIKRRNAGLIPFLKLGRNFFYLKPEGSVCSK